MFISTMSHPFYSIIANIYNSLTESHAGDYLAKKLTECLTRFGLNQSVNLSLFFLFTSNADKSKLHIINMDNASNCNTTALEAAKLMPTFRGAKSRARCFAHILNLIAKVR